MPQPLPSDARRPDRDAAERAADHASIDRLTMELLPTLIARLGATELGELEVREGPWRVLLRRPANGASGTPSPTTRERRPGERAASERGERPAERAQRAAQGVPLEHSLQPEADARYDITALQYSVS